LTNQISTTPRDDKKLENKIKDLEETIRRQENDNHTLSSKINTLKNTIETHKQDTPLIPKVSVSIDSEA